MQPVTIEVDASQVICAVEPRVVGINVDYLVDHDANRVAGARPLRAALREMGVRSLRYPGGDKSDNYLWSTPPFDRPRPALACVPRQGRELGRFSEEQGWSNHPLDFDEFMKLCRSLKAEPTLVVCYDALHAPDCHVTKRQLIETAAAWVQYANVRRGYGVRYWEIGNEGYIDTTVSPVDYARDLVEFARAMKAADPAIWIGANGPAKADGTGRHKATADKPWWQEVFGKAAEHIDFVPVHAYSCWKWGSYETYRDHGPGYPEADRDARDVIEAARWWGPPGFADRLRVTVTEWNAADWSEGGWPKTNDLGHALVVFDLLGTLLTNDRVDNSQLWNTRWTSHDADRPSLWDAVDDYNHLQPTGRALAIWSRFLGERMVTVSEPRRTRTFASTSPGGRLSVFIISKEAESREATIRLMKRRGAVTARRWLWSGTGPDDIRPVWSGPKRAPVEGRAITVPLPADSLTVVEVRPAR
jgi:alpha-N-arabinofuranosidase